MAEPSSAYRLALATLAVPAPLVKAVSDLRASNVPAAAIGLAGTAQALDLVGAHVTPGEGELWRSLLDVQPMTSFMGEGVYATVHNWLTELKAKAAAGPPLPTGSRCLLAPGLRDGLMQRVRQGEVMLIAGPLSPAELTASTRVLLRHSNHPVQSHTFVLPPMP